MIPTSLYPADQPTGSSFAVFDLCVFMEEAFSAFASIEWPFVDFALGTFRLFPLGSLWSSSDALLDLAEPRALDALASAATYIKEREEVGVSAR